MVKAKLGELGGLLVRAAGGGDAPRGDGSGFDRLDPDGLIVEMNIIDQATRHGNNGKPTPDASEPSSIEGSIRERLESAAARAWEEYRSRLGILKRGVDTLGLWNRTSAIEEKAEEFRREMAGNIYTARTELRGTLDRMCETYNKLDAFREEHRLMRDAKLSTSSDLYKGTFIAIFFIVESLANAFYIGSRVEGSVYVGLSIASIISAVNICLGWFMGKSGMPRLLHKDPKNKRNGAIIISSSALAAAFINVCVAHVRTVLGKADIDIQQATIAAWEHLLDGPFKFGDVSSVLFLAVGACFVVLTAIRAFYWDEYYLEYADYTRNYLAAQEELNQKRSDLINGVTDACEDMRGTIRALKSSILADICTCKRLAREMKDLQDTYRGHVAYLEGVLNTVLRRYREINTASRKGLPPPGYFAAKAPLPPRTLEDLSDYTDRDDELQTIAESVEVQAPKAMEVINKEQDNAHQKLIESIPEDLNPSTACGQGSRQHKPDGGGTGQKEVPDAR